MPKTQTTNNKNYCPKKKTTICGCLKLEGQRAEQRREQQRADEAAAAAEAAAAQAEKKRQREAEIEARREAQQRVAEVRAGQAEMSAEALR